MASPTLDRRMGLVGNVGWKAPVTVLAASNITLSGQQTIDGVAVLAINSAGVADRVLVTGQSDATQNGIWDVSTAAWTRSLDANGNYDLGTGSTVLVASGTTYGGTFWRLSTANPITIGTTAQTWALSLANSSSTVSFVQTATGAVTRSVQDRLRDTVNLDDFDTLAHAIATGKNVLVPAATTSIAVASSDVIAVLGGLRQLRVEADLQLDIASGDYTSPTIMNGAPNGQRITVRGASMLSKTISAATDMGGSAGDWAVKFTCNNATGAVVGAFAIVKSIVGTAREKVIEGCWEITAVSGNDITLKVKARKSALPTLTVSSGTLLLAQTIVRVNGAIGIDVVGEGNTFQNMALVGNGSGANVVGVRIQNGVAGFAKSTSFPFGVCNFAEHGFYAITGSTIYCFDSFSSGNGQSGLNCTDNSTASATRLVATGNANHGVVATTKSNVAATTGNFSGNAQRGIYASTTSMITAVSAVVYENLDAGVRADNQGYANVTSAKIAGSGSYGVRCNGACAVTITADYTGSNGAANEFTENNGTIQTGATALTVDFEGQQIITSGHYRQVGAIADDTVLEIDLGSTARIVTVAFHMNVSTTVGTFVGRTVSSPFCSLVSGTGFTATTGVLTGTTGVDGAFTVSMATDGKVYLENRLGASRTVTVDIMGAIK